ncbi:hypothetical protein ABSA28_01180 [Candidatus Hepatincolaceae symbiont of Richtersius coronifer]
MIKDNLVTYLNSLHKIGSLVNIEGILASDFILEVEDVKVLSPSSNIICSNYEAPFCISITVIEEENNAILTS